MRSNYKILIVEDDLITAGSIKTSLMKSGFQIPFVCDNFLDAMKHFDKRKQFPDLIISDIRLKGPKTGIDLAKAVRKISSCEIIFVSGNNQSEVIEQLVGIEHFLFLVKPYSDLQLFTSVELAYKRFVYGVTKMELTVRERQIQKLILDGLKSKEIAEKLFISIDTVSTHRKNILRKSSIRQNRV